ncbi:MAG: restriction endonuclease subunit S [Desulfobacterales bacterium]|nr:restriction endonuclease subunit S [Desulfobacterales bacterium]MDD4072258.1 restriction endonuclease subunit S [Desulfobacterales bacterium]MDD4392796.1 restriction endonuclease subunit S [Desulfobacterales bacterium]
MISKVYPKYKPSGVEWLGDVPEHWGVKRVKFITNVNGRIGFRGYTVEDLVDEGEGALVLGGTNLSKNGKVDLQKRTYLKWDKYHESPEIKVSKGDILLGQRGTCGFPICIDFDIGHSTINPSLVIIKASLHNSSFLCFWLMNDFMKSIVDNMVSSTAVPMLSQEQIGNFCVLLPPLPEQQAIAAFLDRETGRIDSLIAKKQRLLELLAEQRTALISRAVTKGLDATVKLKPSGVEWLGDVPEHWEIWKLAHLTTRIGSGKTPTGGADVYQTEGVLFLRSQNVYDDGLYLDDVVYIDEKIDKEMAWSRVKPKDILLNITGASLGRTCITPKDLGRANVNQHVCVIRLNKSDYSSFIAQYLKSRPAKSFYDFAQTGSAREGLNFEQIGAFPITLPPLPEQQAIAAFLDRETAKIDTLSVKVAAVIERLKEYRTALISSAVTGKIDVRGAL